MPGVLNFAYKISFKQIALSKTVERVQPDTLKKDYSQKAIVQFSDLPVPTK